MPENTAAKKDSNDLFLSLRKKKIQNSKQFTT